MEDTKKTEETKARKNPNINFDQYHKAVALLNRKDDEVTIRQINVAIHKLRFAKGVSTEQRPVQVLRPYFTLTFGDEKDTYRYKALEKLESLGIVTREVTYDEDWKIEKTKWIPTTFGKQIIGTGWLGILYRDIQQDTREAEEAIEEQATEE